MKYIIYTFNEQDDDKGKVWIANLSDGKANVIANGKITVSFKIDSIGISLEKEIMTDNNVIYSSLIEANTLEEAILLIPPELYL